MVVVTSEHLLPGFLYVPDVVPEYSERIAEDRFDKDSPCPRFNKSLLPGSTLPVMRRYIF
jgi:hypothetical protein